MRAGERLGIVVIPVNEQKLQACPPEQSTGGAEESTPFRLARQIAEIAEGDERVTALLNSALDQAAQMPSVAMQVTEDEQPAHSSRAYRARLGSPLAGTRDLDPQIQRRVRPVSVLLQRMFAAALAPANYGF